MLRRSQMLCFGCTFLSLLTYVLNIIQSVLMLILTISTHIIGSTTLIHHAMTTYTTYIIYQGFFKGRKTSIQAHSRIWINGLSEQEVSVHTVRYISSIMRHPLHASLCHLRSHFWDVASQMEGFRWHLDGGWGLHVREGGGVDRKGRR